MPSLRKDPITGRWVIMSKSRLYRPNDYISEQAQGSATLCPFCEGNEHLTPEEIYAVRAVDSEPDSSGWQVRVLPNKFPALEVNSTAVAQQNGIFQSIAGVGVHEVIVESPNHTTEISQFEAQQFITVLQTYRHRLLDIKENRELLFALIFKNAGQAGGASLRHSHSQLLAMPVIPSLIQEEMSCALQYYQQHGKCVFCEMLQQELDFRGRIVLESEHFIAFCPFASRFAGETWIFPRQHCNHFELITDEQIEDLAPLMLSILKKIESQQAVAGYNYVIHSAAFHADSQESYHWHIEIIPRTTQIAGYELGTGSYINSIVPEEAAEILRQDT